MTPLQEFASRHKHFLWWVPDITQVGRDGIIEATLSAGTMEDKKELVKIVGKEEFKKDFDAIVGGRRRINLEPRTINYWTRYLSR